MGCGVVLHTSRSQTLMVLSFDAVYRSPDPMWRSLGGKVTVGGGVSVGAFFFLLSDSGADNSTCWMASSCPSRAEMHSPVFVSHTRTMDSWEEAEYKRSPHALGLGLRVRLALGLRVRLSTQPRWPVNWRLHSPVRMSHARMLLSHDPEYRIRIKCTLM